MFGEWKVDVVYRPEYLGYAVYMSRKMRGRHDFLNASGKVTSVDEGKAMNLDKQYVFAILDPDQVQGIADAFANVGIHTVNDHKNAGLLEATQNHLEDMRSIVFKTKPDHRS